MARTAPKESVTVMTAMNIPGSQFRRSYSNLIKAIWINPDVARSISADPSKLRNYGFVGRPKSVKFVAADGRASAGGYEQQLENWTANHNGGPVTFTVPPKPAIDDTGTVMASDSCCCCCCPCCCCT